MSILWLDYETRSRCNLLTAGAYNYAQDPSTEIICLGYSFDDERVIMWTPNEPFPKRVADHFKSGGQIRAHNAAFDRLITWYVLCPSFDVPEPKLTSWYCTAAQARANCYPGSLEDAGRFSSAIMKKDFKGSQLVRQLSIPRADGTFNYDPTLLGEMANYCRQDVRAMRNVSKNMRQLTEEELLDYHINERINERGIRVDVPLAKAATAYAAIELQDVEQLVQEITKGAITSVRSTKMKSWVLERVGEQAKKLMVVVKDGEEKMSVDKSVRANLLILADENADEVPPEVADVLQCASDIWASSVAKFTRMAKLADPEDSRVRGAFIFNGGSATGRVASYGLQLQNMARKTAKDPEAVRKAMLNSESLVPNFGKSVSEVLKGMIRPALLPAEGNAFVVLDWAAIEARVNPWLSKHPQGQEVLDVFRAGEDIYVKEAAKMFKVPEDKVTPEQRTIGKVAILACGYGGGVGAFSNMGRNYGILLPENESKATVNAWRKANQWAVQYWRDTEEAYTKAMRFPIKDSFVAGRVGYYFDSVHLWYSLPSGRLLCYPFARFDDDGGISYAKSAWKPESDAKEWSRARLWAGIAVENVCQATANDLLRYVLRQIDDVVLTAHDEVLIECKIEDAPARLEQAKEIMCTPPAWCQDLPLAVEGKILTRYGNQ